MSDVGTPDLITPDPDSITIPGAGDGATDPIPPTTPAARPPRTFTAADIEKARQEEKEKLYARLGKVDDLETEMKSLRAEREVAEKARKDAERETEKARKEKEREDLSAKDYIDKLREEFEGKLQKESEERARIEAILQKEQELGQLQTYLAGRMMEWADQDPSRDEFPNGIMPQLRGRIGGNTQEEIDASIRWALETTEDILGSFQQHQTNAMAAVPTISPRSGPPMGPADLTEMGSKTFSPADIQNMSAGEYAEYRERLLSESGKLYRGGR